MRAYIKVEEITKFRDIEIHNQTFHQHKEPISIKNVDVDKIVVSNKASFCKRGFKYFIGYKKVSKIRPLCVFVPKTSAYKQDFDETKYCRF